MQVVHGLGFGGAEVYVAQLTRHLRRRGDDVRVVCLDTVGPVGDRLKQGGIPVEALGRRPGLDVSLPRKIAHAARRHAADIVHAHQFPSYVYASVAGLLQRTPLVFTEHGRHIPDVAGRLRRLFNRVFEPRLVRTFAVSRSVRDALVRIDGFPAGRIEVLLNGVDLERFRPRTDAAEARRVIGVPNEATVVGTVGRLEAAKNHALLLRVIARIRTEMPEVQLVIVGDGPERDRLETLARDLGILGHVRFLGERHDVERLLPAFALFALGSQNEATPLTLLEAMAAEVAIVATAVGGVPDVLDAGREALLVAPDPERLEERFTAAVRRGLNDVALRNTLRAAARARAEGRHAEGAVFDRYREIYRVCLAEHP